MAYKKIVAGHKKKNKKIRYEPASDIMALARDIIKTLTPNFNHIDINNISCIRSFNSSSRRTIARCHGLGKAFQLALRRKSFYVLEFLSERFDKLEIDKQVKVVIHELLHIPKNFGGGFKHHDYVSDAKVNSVFKTYKNLKQKIHMS